MIAFWSWPAHYRGIRLFHFYPRQAKILTTVNVCMVKCLWRYAHFQENVLFILQNMCKRNRIHFFWRPLCTYKTFIQKAPELVPQKFHVHLELLLFALKSVRITNFINNWVGIQRAGDFSAIVFHSNQFFSSHYTSSWRFKMIVEPFLLTFRGICGCWT